jgi:hypothetical protein
VLGLLLALLLLLGCCWSGLGHQQLWLVGVLTSVVLLPPMRLIVGPTVVPLKLLPAPATCSGTKWLLLGEWAGLWMGEEPTGKASGR